MTDLRVVSNSSPLIALKQIGQLELLERLFSPVMVPPAVVREVAPSLSLPSWIIERPLAQPLGSQILRISLGSGESEAITLALETKPKWILLDDRPARRLAEALGLCVTGTLGILLASKHKGLIPRLRPCLDSLMKNDFRLSDSLYKLVLSDAGE